MLISTMNDVPGYRVTSVLGEVFGLTVRSRNVGSQFGAAFKSLAGGELKGMTKNLQLSREDVVKRMVERGRGPRRQRRPGHALRHLRDGRELDRDLRLRHGRRHRADRVNPAADARTDLVRACLREPVSRTPVWFMRQAGRSLPEYRAAAGRGLHPLGHRGRAARRRADPAAGPPLRRGRRHPVLRHRGAAARHRLRRRGGARPRTRGGRAVPRRGRPRRLRPFEPEADAPYVAEAVRLVRARAGGSGVALIGFAGAPFTVASYLVEGGPSRTFARVKALMHARARAVGPADRAAGRHGGGLAAGAGAGRGRRPCSSSTAGRARSRPTSTTRFALPATRAVSRGRRRPRRADHPLRRRHRRAARADGHGRTRRRRESTGACPSTRRAAASARLRACRATSTRRSAWPRGPSSRRPTRAVLDRAPPTATRHRSRVQPRPRRAARDRPGHPGRGRRPGARGDRPDVTVGVLRDGARDAGRAGGDRALLHPHPARAPARAGAAGRAGGPLRGHRRRLPAGRAHPAQVDARARRARAGGAGPLRRRLRGQAHGAPHRGGGRRAGRRRDSRRWSVSC